MDRQTPGIKTEKLRSLRASKQWTQEHVAGLLHISPSQYARIEHGEVSPRMEMLFKLAALFETDAFELIEAVQHFSQTQFAYSSPEATQAQQSNVYHNTYYGNDAMAAELEKLQQNLRHQSELLKQQEAMLHQKDEEIALLKEMLTLLKNGRD